jgi:uroporphyrinogen-III synthase
MGRDDLHPAPLGGAPLGNIRVVVTRAEHQAAGLVAALREAGARVETLPLLSVVPPLDPSPLAAAAADLAAYRWVVFTSANAVEALASQVAAWPAAIGLAAVGDATARALAERGLRCDLVAGRAQAEGLLADLLPRLAAGERVLLPQAADARPLLAQGLRAAGIATHPVIAYRKERPDVATARARELFPPGAPLGWVTFTSPSIVHAFAGLFGDGWAPRRASLRAASIGPLTSAALRALGVEPAAVAATPGEVGLVSSIAAALAADSRPQAAG